MARLYSKTTTASTMTVKSEAWLPYFRVRKLNACRNVRRGTAGGVCSGGRSILLPSPTCRFYRTQSEKQAKHRKEHKVDHILRFDDALGKVLLVPGKRELGEQRAESRPRKVCGVADEPEKEETRPGECAGNDLVFRPGRAQKAKGKQRCPQEERAQIASPDRPRVEVRKQRCQQWVEKTQDK